MKALSSAADILIGGGAAGVGKTFCLLMEALRNIYVKNYGGVIFRRTTPQIRAQGGLWDASTELYSKIQGAEPSSTYLEWRFGKNSKIKFSHLQYEKDVLDWQGSELPFIGFDELTHFSKKMFFYMLTRNRSTCGVNPYIRATCNPDPDSWVAEFIDWFISEDGFPDPEKEGVIRYFMIGNDEYIWGSSKKEVIEKGWHLISESVEKSGSNPENFVKSMTFVGGSIYDNQKLLSKDPGYLASLNAQDEETKAQLLHGNWKVKPSPSDVYDYFEFRDIFNNEHLIDSSDSTKYITADIALKGSDKMVVLVWKGMCIIDCIISDKNDGREAVEKIKSMISKHSVNSRNVIFDNDGVGGGMSGFIRGAKEFHNGSKPQIGGKFGINYQNLKTQCYYMSGETISEVYIVPEVYNMMYDEKTTIKQRFMKERKAIKRDKVDEDGKLRIVPKSQMKVFIGGESPDLMDAFMMRQAFCFEKKHYVY